MKNLKVAERYAKSLLDLAVELGKLEEVKSDMDTIKSLTANRDFYLFLKSPIIKPEKKKSTLDAILSQIELSEMTQSFARILVNKGREGNLPEIAAAFDTQYKIFKKITSVKVTSATPLSEEELLGIRQKLATMPDITADVDIQVAVDSSLIGGFVIEYNGNVYDSSVSQKIKELRKDFSKVNVYVSRVSK